MRQIVLIWLIFVMGASYCNRRPTGSQSSVLGKYQLSANDNSGRLAFTGTILLTSLERHHVKGQCTVVPEKNATQGLLNDNGDCEGVIDGKLVSIDTAPFMDDAGLLLEGQIGDGRITGIWKIDGFATSKALAGC